MKSWRTKSSWQSNFSAYCRLFGIIKNSRRYFEAGQHIETSIQFRKFWAILLAYGWRENELQQHHSNQLEKYKMKNIAVLLKLYEKDLS